MLCAVTALWLSPYNLETCTRCSPALDDSLKKLVEKKQSLQREVTEQEALYKARSTALEEQNRGLSALVARSEAVPAIVETLVALRSSLTHEKCALKVRALNRPAPASIFWRFCVILLRVTARRPVVANSRPVVFTHCISAAALMPVPFPGLVLTSLR